jgi:hypothetical protein
MSVSCCTIALYIHCTYMVQTCLYTFMPGGQDSRCFPETASAATQYYSVLKHFKIKTIQYFIIFQVYIFCSFKL